MICRKAQAGAVNMLLVSLTGLAALAISATNINSIRGTQEFNLTAQTVNQAASTAWRGVEILKTHLTGIGVQNPHGKTLDFENLSIAIDRVQFEQNGIWSNQASGNLDPAKNYRIRAFITGEGAANSRKTLEVFYSLAPSGNSSPDPDNNDNSNSPARLPDLVSIHSNLTLQGGINIQGNNNANFMVDGNATLSGSVTGLNQLCATGDVNIQSGITVNYVCSNKSVTISQGATVGQIVAIGQVNLNSGTASVENVHSNGNVVMNGGGVNATNVNTKGNFTISGGNGRITGTLNAEGNVSWTSNFNSVGTINANGNVTYSGRGSGTIRSRGNVILLSNASVANLYALGWIDIQSGGNTGVTGTLRGANTSSTAIKWVNHSRVFDGVVRGTWPTPPQFSSNVNIRRDANLVLEIPAVSVPVIDPIIMERPVIDANTFKESANYVFFYENGKRRVTVKNVEGINDGTYFIASYSTNNTHDYLCTALNGNFCSEPTLANKGRTLCMGFGTGNSCFDQSSAGNWVFNGQSLAPGTAWFEGNLKLANGKFVNTFLASGHIDITQGSVRVYSPNYGGFAAVCTDTKGFSISTDHRLSGIRPKNFCDGNNYVASPLGNVALLAGSFNNNIFSGGNINLSASNEIYGSIMAGGILKTSGSTKMYGALVVANTPATGTTQIQGGVSIDLSNLPSTYDPLAPGVIPCVGDDCEVEESPPNDDQGASGANTVQRLWTRYAD